MFSVRTIGITACITLIISTFLRWTWYQDIQKYFTGYFSQDNHYGRPGWVLLFFAIVGIICFLLDKNWAKRTNLIIGAMCGAYAFKSFLLFSGGYDGYVPVKQAGIYIMLISATVYLIMAMLGQSLQKPKVNAINQP